jgi:preprotein translocase subunit SecG
MILVAAVDWLHYMFMIPLTLLSVFLMLVILVQRGRGGGLTGALGGMGGQSAFGTKAGDLFTRVTIVVAAIWVLLSMASIKVLGHRSSTGGLSAAQRGQVTTPGKTGDTTPSATAPTGKGAEADTTSAAPGATSPASETATPPATGSAPSSAPPPQPAPADAEKSTSGADKP